MALISVNPARPATAARGVAPDAGTNEPREGFASGSEQPTVGKVDFRARHAAVSPPSSTTVCPVTDAASGLVSQHTADATSSAVASRASSRDARSGFIDYVPTGSIKRGEALVTTGGDGKTVPCGICHGPTYKGLAEIPALAGSTGIYLVRQLNDNAAGLLTERPCGCARRHTGVGGRAARLVTGFFYGSRDAR